MLRRITTICCFIATLQLDAAQLNSRQQQEVAIFQQIFLRQKPNEFGPKRYDNRVEPKGQVVVRVSMAIESISAVNSQTDFKVQLTLQKNWTDTRLAYHAASYIKYYTLTDVFRIWKPNLYFLNEIYGSYHYVVNPNTFARIYPNGQVIFNIRITLYFNCKINYHQIPFDNYECIIPITNFDSKQDNVIVEWSEQDAISISNQLTIPLFKLKMYVTEACNSSNSEGEGNCIQVKLIFKRMLHAYMNKYFVPFMALVIVSWFPFWVSHDATFLRVSVPVFTIWVARDLCFAQTIDKSSPHNTWALDIWMTFCFLLLIAAFLQYVLLIFLLHRREEKSPPVNKNAAMTKIEDKISGKRCERIDSISRFVFPIVFFLFNLLYWSIYMGRRQTYS